MVKMASEPKKEFISLAERPEETLAMPAKNSKPEARGPSFYVSDIPLPITDADVDTVMTAEVKIKPKRVSTTKENGRTRRSYDFEIVGIKF